MHRIWRALLGLNDRPVLENVELDEDAGVVVGQVPWARHGARQTRAFEDTAAWLVAQCSKAAVTALLRISWRTVGPIVERVMAEVDTQVDRLDGLIRIRIDPHGTVGRLVAPTGFEPASPP